MRKLFTAVISLALLGIAACANSDTDTNPTPEGDDYSTSGMAITADALADTDIRSMFFEVKQVSCAGKAASGQTLRKVKDYIGDGSDKSRTLPGEFGNETNPQYDDDSGHIFSDAYFTLDSDCRYDVTTTPLKVGPGINPNSVDSNDFSDDCSGAQRQNVSMLESEGQTLEIHLINQCKGENRGGMDVIGSINHPPTVRSLEFPTSKFLTSCHENLSTEAKRRVCVRADDPDDDPLAFDWQRTEDGEFLGSIAELPGYPQDVPGTDQVESCAKVSTNQAGKYGFDVTVYDLDGSGTRIEDLLESKPGAEFTTSRDNMNFPMYAGLDCRARNASMLMAMGNDPGPKDSGGGLSKPFIKQTADWAKPRVSGNKVIYVLDDDNNGEHLPGQLTPGSQDDRQWVTDALEDRFGASDVRTITEDPGGIEMSDLMVDGRLADIVWFANPGFPVRDQKSADTLKQVLTQRGRAVITQGNDTSWDGVAGNADMGFFTGLTFRNNGTSACGLTTDSNAGTNYQVQYSNEPVSALDGLRGQSFQYGNDIDLNTLRHPQNGIARVLANGQVFKNGQVCESTRVATATDPIDL